MSDGSNLKVDRRSVLSMAAGGGMAALAGCSLFEPGEDGPATAVADDRAMALAERYAPTIYFDKNERWFPTDPRAYESEDGGDVVVSGFDAFEGYVTDWSGDDPPDPVLFYHAVEYENSPLAVVQFWMYSVFDQFTTNFHWHDWELLQVFHDTESDEPQLYVASSHSRSIPNNEYLDPGQRPRILTELGSHSSGLSVNDDDQHFQRFPLSEDIADITNSVIDGIEDIATIPLAYGLPRDEGLPLPFLVPELNGAPIYDHDRLPTVQSSDLVPFTVRSFDDIRSPPTNLPTRETGQRFEYRGRDATDADVTYDLRPSADLEHIQEFTGPQLSFEFRIPDFAEDLFAGHISTTGVPWKGDRYTAPASDISETKHRQALSDRYDAIGEPSEVSQVVAGVTNAVPDDGAPNGEGLVTVDSPLELFMLFQSEPRAVPTFRGVAVVQGVPAGEHRLTVNGAGVAPHSETVTVSESASTTTAGVDGEIPTVARKDATKLEVDPGGTDSDLRNLAIEDDFAGRLYDAPLDGPDAVYVHRGGAFTTEVRDSDDNLGAFRVNPDTEDRVRIDHPDTGVASLARYVGGVAEETRAQVAAVGSTDDDDDGSASDDDDGSASDDRTTPGGGGSENAVQGLATALAAIAEAADRAAERAEAGDRAGAQQRLDTVAARLERVGTRLSEAKGDLPPELARATEKRLAQADRRTGQAKRSEKL